MGFRHRERSDTLHRAVGTCVGFNGYGGFTLDTAHQPLARPIVQQAVSVCRPRELLTQRPQIAIIRGVNVNMLR